ncbi:MAG: TetR/AcrR family transcriptional regulator [Alphaproteobacteria bacterium]|nr:TetR/AcrR family transcriptional regulator [Alphaproteobacteria bacterium]
MSETKPYHHGDLREQLLQAGEQALAEMPMAQVSLREIARKAGVSHAAPKHHFPTLGDLMGEIAARGFQRFVAALDEAANSITPQTAENRLLAMGRAYLRFAEVNSAVYTLMFDQRDSCSMTPHLVETSLEAWGQLENAVAALRVSGNASIGAMFVWSTVHGLAMLKSTHRLPPHLTLHAVEENTLRMIVTGIATL